MRFGGNRSWRHGTPATRGARSAAELPNRRPDTLDLLPLDRITGEAPPIHAPINTGKKRGVRWRRSSAFQSRVRCHRQVTHQSRLAVHLEKKVAWLFALIPNEEDIRPIDMRARLVR